MHTLLLASSFCSPTKHCILYDKSLRHMHKIKMWGSSPACILLLSYSPHPHLFHPSSAQSSLVTAMEMWKRMDRFENCLAVFCVNWRSCWVHCWCSCSCMGLGNVSHPLCWTSTDRSWWPSPGTLHPLLLSLFHQVGCREKGSRIKTMSLLVLTLVLGWFLILKKCNRSILFDSIQWEL